MPLDRENGEKLDGLPGRYVVVPARAVAELSNAKVGHETWKGLRKKIEAMPIFDDAVAHAMQAFSKAGSLVRRAFDDDEVLVQVYPQETKVAIMFQRKIAGQEYFCTRIYDLPRPLIDNLLSGAPVRH